MDTEEKTLLEKSLDNVPESVSGDITEKVCLTFMRWCGYYCDEAPFGLKAEIFKDVLEIIKKNYPECERIIE